jgi:hypothetical protein
MFHRGIKKQFVDLLKNYMKKLFAFSHLGNKNHSRLSNKRKKGIYFWGLSLKNGQKPENENEFALLYVGKSQKNIFERLMQEFSQLIFGGFGTLFNHEYLKNLNFEYNLNQINQDTKNQLNKSKVVYSPQNMAELSTFHLAPSAELIQTLEYYKRNLYYSYLELSTKDEIKEAEKIIHQVVRPHITGLGKIKSPIKNAKALTKATNEWKKFKNKHSENLNPIIVKWVDTCMNIKKNNL